MPPDRVARALLDDLAVVHDGDAVAHQVDDREVVADEQAREALLALQLLEQLEHGRLHRDVERARRLVGDEQLGAHRQRPGDADALLFAGGKLMRIIVCYPGRQPHHVEQFPHPFGLGGAAGLRVERQRLRDQAFDRPARVERYVRLLEHHLNPPAQRAELPLGQGGDIGAVEQHPARGREFQPAQDAQQRRLARARGPQQRHQRPRGNGQADRVQRRGLAEGLGDFVDLDMHGNLGTQ